MADFLVAQIKKRKEIVKFIISGGTAALTNLSLFYFFTDILGIWYLLSSVLSFVVSFFVSFYLQKFWTFGDTNKEALYKQMVLYLLMAFFNLIINTAAMYVLVDFFKVWYMLAQFFITAIIALWNFIVYKFFIFKRASEMKA
ncbi:GtrA family protein [Patescibacteria group bacterium]|nr:GtrA family protein [Patescibacteria group bacterium]